MFLSTASLKSVCLNTTQVLLLHTKIWELFLGIVLGVLQSILQLGSFWSIAPDTVSWYHPRLEERRKANLCLFNLEEVFLWSLLVGLFLFLLGLKWVRWPLENHLLLLEWGCLGPIIISSWDEYYIPGFPNHENSVKVLLMRKEGMMGVDI